MKARDLIIGFLLVGLYALSMISFGIGLADLNSANQSIGDDPRIINIIGNLSSELNKSQATAEGQRDAFEQETPKLGTGSLLFESLAGVLKTFTGTFVVMFNIIFELIFQVFSIPPVVLSVVISIALIMIVFLGWRFLRVGD